MSRSSAIWVAVLALSAAHPSIAASPSVRSSQVSSAPFPRQYEAIYHDDDGLDHAGVLSMTADGKLAVVTADDRFAHTLDVAVRSMNAMQAETIRVPPAPGTPRFALKSRIVPRESPEFIPTMLANMRRNYRLELRQAEAP